MTKKHPGVILKAPSKNTLLILCKFKENYWPQVRNCFDRISNGSAPNFFVFGWL